jgi:hypothetical protein
VLIARRTLAAGWRILVCLVPISFLPAIVAVASGVFQLAPQAGDSLIQLSIAANLLVIAALLVSLWFSAAAGVSVIRGRPVSALVTLGVVAAVWLLAGLWPGHLRILYFQLLALPGAVAFVVALLGLPHVLRLADRRMAVTVLILLALPPLTFGAIRADLAVYYARDCPAGPEIDLTVSGLESAHFNRACDLPLSGTELTGCRNGTATVGLLTWDGPWFLIFYSVVRGTVTSDKTPYLAPYLLVSGNLSYGGPIGWRGSYTVDGVCRGHIDADLFGALAAGQTYAGSGPPVHLQGTWDTPVIS